MSIWRSAQAGIHNQTPWLRAIKERGAGIPSDRPSGSELTATARTTSGPGALQPSAHPIPGTTLDVVNYGPGDDQ